ncbi:mannose-1-phosphate guanylyltransferase/mannose-6-phosphate isomerase [SAR92 clade bacterium H231]|nr:mannose-1-phosphate guanylyltransferase/mannose-6-phosphate isomerase [SAR92 clade bacterium H231]
MGICPVIMAGGSGTRLWPLSRAAHPKQFLKLHGEDTMLQATVKRLSGLNTQGSITICNEEHRFLVAEQLRELDKQGSIILEPVGRNTAPAIALAALTANDDPLLLVLAADHVIQDEAAFHAAVMRATPLAEAGKLVTFGIVPAQPHTGYGYIRRGKDLGEGFEVDAFVEKPSSDVAQDYFSSGDYYWNSGMFLFRASNYLEELKKFRPDILEQCKASVMEIKADFDFLRINREMFESCAAESVDYAVMEKTSRAVVVPMDAGWSDIGSWSSLWDISEKDGEGNSIHGDVVLHNTHNSYVRTDDKLVTAIGVDELVIIATKDTLMVAHKNCAQDVKIITEMLKANSRSEWELSREVYRPWGKYDSIDSGEGYQVKRITVKPGAKLSVQMHHHRAEHWVVVGGSAMVTSGGKTFLLSVNESTYIPIGVVHALENPGNINLELIEVQSGSYLGEDDIVRFEDRYGR